MTLTMAKSGEKWLIKKIIGRDDVSQHLADMGFVAGEYVTVINELGGNMILDVKGVRVALDKSLLNRIVV